MSTEKKEASSKSLNKIHRRRNDEIPKEFQCTEGCGKAYGSYAALYTHIKNKHADAKPPQMKQQSSSAKVKVAKKGRPLAEKNAAFGQLENDEENLNESGDQNQAECKVCCQEECVCVEDFSSEDRAKTIRIMSNQDFVSFVNIVGNLTLEEKLFTWVRNTENVFVFYSEERIGKMVHEFNRQNGHFSDLNSQRRGEIELLSVIQEPRKDSKCEEQSDPLSSAVQAAESMRWGIRLPVLKFSKKVIEFLSFSSRYWASDLIDELYQSIFVMKVREGRKEVVETLRRRKQQFRHMIECAEKTEEFEEFCNLIRII